jgi:hypothetical protein
MTSTLIGPVLVVANVAACHVSPEAVDAPVGGGGIVVSRDAWDLAAIAVAGAGLGTPDAVRNDDGGLRLYYYQTVDAGGAILAADSVDGMTWTPRPTPVLADPAHALSGPSVIRLPDGRQRMFVHAWDPAAGGDHVRSAVSTDGGVTFIDEGVAIADRTHDPASPWAGVGHGAVYALASGGWAAMFTVTAATGGGPDLALFTSSDGLHFDYVRTLYLGWHDPVVVARDGQYLLMAEYADQYPGALVSPDGVTWYPEVTRIDLADPGQLLGTAGAGARAGELGAVMTPAGKLLLLATLHEESGGGIAVFLAAD